MKSISTILLWFTCTRALALGFGEPLPGQNLFPAKSQSTMLSYSVSLGRTLMHEVRVDYFVHDHVSLLYSMGYAYSPYRCSSADGGYGEFRAPIGPSIGIGLASVIACCSYYYGDGFGDLFLFCCMIPDGVAFHVPIGEKFDLSPYILLSGLSLQWSNNNNNELVYSPMAGVRLMYPLSQTFVFSAEQNFRRTADNTMTASAALGLSVVF